MSIYTSIIIPTYNALPLLVACINAIREHTSSGTYEIIVVDNGSTDGTAEYCIREGIDFISFSANRGFPKACNAGLSIAKGDSLLLLNNDITVTPNWLINLNKALYSSPEVGIVGPITNYASGLQQIHVEFADLAQFQRIAADNNQSNSVRWKEVRRIIGMCMLIKREVLSSVGLLDEAFSPGHYEDDDYCYRTRAKGYRLLVCEDVLVHHEGSASFRKIDQQELSLLIERNHRLFMNKWQVDPLQFINS